MYEKFYTFILGSSLLTERDMRPFLSLEEMKKAVYDYVCYCFFVKTDMEAPLSREEKRKLKKKERKRKQRQCNAALRKENETESDNESCEKRQKLDEKEALEDASGTTEELRCCECQSEDVRYRCDDCKKVYCVDVIVTQ